MDRIQAIRLFIRVVDLGSFSRAAADMSIGQPSATKLVAQLEKHLGSRLLHRSTHGVTPTEIGLLYYEKCKLIAHHVDEADSVAALLQSQVQGALRISTSVAFGRRVLVPLVMRFMQAHPKLQVDLSFEDRYVNLVEQGIDVAIRMGPLADSTLGVRYLGINPWGVVASVDYLKQRGVPDRPSELSTHDALVYSSVQGDARWHFGRGWPSGAGAGQRAAAFEQPVRAAGGGARRHGRGGLALVRGERVGAQRCRAAHPDPLEPAVAGDSRRLPVAAAGAGQGQRLRRMAAGAVRRILVVRRSVTARCGRCVRRGVGCRVIS